MGVALLAYAGLAALTSSPAAADDPARDFLLARDCSALGRCHTLGASTTVTGIYQGATWLHLLAGVQAVGGGPLAVQRVVLAQMAAAIALLAVVVARTMGRRAALVATVAWWAGLAAMHDAESLWNHSPLALPVTLASAAILLASLTGRFEFVAIGGFATGLAISIHPEAVVLALAVVFVGGVACARPLAAVLAGGVLIVAPIAFTSWEALRVDVAVLTTRPALEAGAVTAIVFAALVSWLRPRWKQLALASRARAGGLAVLLPFALAGAWLRFADHHPFYFQYALGALPTLCVTLGSIVASMSELVPRSWRSAPTVACVLLIAASLSADGAYRRPPTSWSMEDGEGVARRIFRTGASWHGVKLGIEGPRCRDVMTSLAQFAPAPSAHPVPASESFLVVPRSSLGPTVVTAVPSWLDRRDVTVCFEHVGAETECHRVLSDPREFVGPSRFLFGRRSYPEAHSFRPEEPYTVSYAFAVSPQPGPGPWTLDVLDDRASRCPWQITRIEGVAFEGALPASTVRLLRHAASGRLTVAKAFDAQRCGRTIDRRLPPCMIETSPSDAALRARALEER